MHRLTGGSKPPRGRHVAVVPGSEAALLPVDLPEGLRGLAREKVAERQVLDMLGAAPRVDTRPAQIGGAGRFWKRALVAEADRIDMWRKEAGRSCLAVLPDYLILPTSDHLWTIGLHDGVVLARLGPADGFSAHEVLAAPMLERALAEAGEARPKAVYALPGAPDWVKTLFEDAGIRVVTTPREVAKQGLQKPVVLRHGEIGLDLRNDPSAERALLRRTVLPWRWPFLAGLLAVSVWSATQLIAIRGLEEALQNERDAMIEATRETLVPTGPVLDVRAQVRRVIADLRADAQAAQRQVSPLVPLGDALGVVYAANAETQIILVDRDGAVFLTLGLEDFAAVDRIVEMMTEVGLVTDVQSAGVDEDGSGVRVELRLVPATEGGSR